MIKTTVSRTVGIGAYIALSTLFGVKIVLGITTIALAARWLDAAGFVFFVQAGLLSALVNLIAAGAFTTGVTQRIAEGNSDKSSTIGTALISSLGISTALTIGGVVFAHQLSDLIGASPNYGIAVVLIIFLTGLAAPGQVLGAYLTGAGHASDAMFSQALALAIAAGVACIGLYRHDSQLAAIAFAFGLALHTPMALVLVYLRSLNVPNVLKSFHKTEFLVLARFSGVFVVTASILPIALFAMRDYYKDIYGVALLAGWLAANRLSDVFTQFVGLYMAQIYLPVQTRLLRNTYRERITTYMVHAVIATSAMILGAIVFFLHSGFWLKLIFGKEGQTFSQIVSIYMIGDIFKAWVIVALSSLLSRANLFGYAAIEVTNTIMFITITLALFGTYGPMSPGFAYIITNLVLAFGGLALFTYSERGSMQR